MSAVPNLNSPPPVSRLLPVCLLVGALAVSAGCSIDLRKRIPVGGGLGGGSSNLAQVLLGLKRLWGAEIPRETLQQLASEIGADAPFFFAGPSAISTGTGVRCAPVALRWQGWLVLVSVGRLVPTS